MDKQDFFIKSETADSSITPINDYDEIISLSTRKLSNFISKKRVKLPKFEAEGFEPELLEGCGNALKNIAYVTADVSFERGIEQQTTMPEVTNYLLGNGFEVVNIENNRLVVLFRNKNFNSVF